MKDFIIKYANLAIIWLLLLLPLRPRAKLLWGLFTLKQKIFGHE